MKNIWMALIATLITATILEWLGWWWAMPVAGLIAGWMLASGKRGFLYGGLGVMISWLVFVIIFAATSPLGKLLVVFSGILGLDSALSFVPVLLALLVAFLLGGFGGMTGGLAAQARQS